MTDALESVVDYCSAAYSSIAANLHKCHSKDYGYRKAVWAYMDIVECLGSANASPEVSRYRSQGLANLVDASYKGSQLNHRVIRAILKGFNQCIRDSGKIADTGKDKDRKEVADYLTLLLQKVPYDEARKFVDRCRLNITSVLGPDFLYTEGILNRLGIVQAKKEKAPPIKKRTNTGNGYHKGIGPLELPVRSI